MRIAFVGKGGSGKTTISSLFCRYLASLGKPVLAIDADINQHLGEALGFSRDAITNIPPIGDALPAMRAYFRGSNPRLKEDGHLRASTPPGTGSHIIRDAHRDPFILEYSAEHEGMRLLRTGSFGEEDVGKGCYHGKTSSVEILLNHLVDSRDDYVVVDMTAGADAFSSSLFSKFDVLALVVEPTRKSLDVLRQYRELGAAHGLRIMAIGNKVMSEEDRAYLTSETRDALGAVMPASEAVRRAERGITIPFSEYETPVREQIERIKNNLDATEKNWNAYYERLTENHREHAARWLTKSLGIDATEQIDPAFSGERLARE